jgi:hypothetical protein
MTQVRRLKIYLLGERDYPEAVVTVPEHMLRDLAGLVAQAREQNPAVRLDAVIANIWRLGSNRLRQNLIRGIPVRMGDVQKPIRTLRPPVRRKRRESWIL